MGKFELKRSTDVSKNGTAGYDGIIKEKMTLVEFMREILTEHEEEWGRIALFYDGRIRESIGYSGGKLMVDPGPAFTQRYEEPVLSFSATGGWSMMDYILTIPDTVSGGIWEKVPVTELLAGLAEECGELTQAALKLRRVLDGTNPTPTTEEIAHDKLYEETADVLLYIDMLKLNNNALEEIKREKLNRWKKRLGIE